MDKISLKNDTKCNKYTPHMFDVSPYKKCANLHIDSLGNTKVILVHNLPAGQSNSTSLQAKANLHNHPHPGGMVL